MEEKNKNDIITNTENNIGIKNNNFEDNNHNENNNNNIDININNNNNINNSENKTNNNKKNNKKQKNQNKELISSTNNNNNNNKNNEEKIALFSIWYIHPIYSIPLTQFTLCGYSLAALRTNFYIKELGIMFDAGLAAPAPLINHLFITHCHSDHIANLPFHIYSYNQKEKIKIYIPKEIKTLIKNYIESAYLLSSYTFPEQLNIKNEELYLYNFYELIECSENMSFNVEIKKKMYKIETFKCFHSVPCLGYGISEIRKKLKEEYKNLKGKEIAELRKKNIEINDEVYIKFIVYLTDTDKEILKNEEIYKYKTIVIECTFFKEEDCDNAYKTKHIHWKDIEEYIKKYKDNYFILIHFSQRYEKIEIENFFETKIKNFPNLIPWIN
jgi:ribonuclease Z